ncbi:MAG: lysostaphin resistance A-like protein [Candidatus Latescibacterota bacterium]
MTDRPQIHSIQTGDRAFTRMLSLPFIRTHCGAASALVLCGAAYFFLPVLERVTVQAFSPKQYVLFYQHILLAALLTVLVCALSHIERIPLSAQALGLSLRIPRERKNFVLPYVALMALAGLSISLFLGYFKYKGVPIHQLVLPLPVELLSLRAADGPGEHLLAILPYAISVLVLSPIVEEIYFTRIVFPALRNRLGLVAGACLTASIFALFHPSANVLSDGTWIPFFVIAGAQLTSCALYQGTRSLYPSIASHALRNFTVFFLGVSALY